MKTPLVKLIVCLSTLSVLLGATAFSQASKLVITSVNGGVSPQAGIGFSVTVQSQDIANLPANVLTPTTVTLTRKTGTGVLGGTVSGIITAGTDSVVISGVTYTKAEAGVVITATASGGDLLLPDDSSPFSVVAGPAAKLAFTTQPGNGTGGSPLTTQPIVTLQDANGNTVTGSAETVTIAIQNNPGGGALSGTTSMAVNTLTGQAPFSNLSIDKIGTGYTLTATGSTVSTTPGTVISSPFNITLGAPARLGFVAQPTASTGGVVISPAVTVQIEDAGGNPVSDSRSVSVAIGTNPSGGTLSGTLSHAASAGLATFNDLSINFAGNGYTLSASAAGLAPATSGAFNILVGPAAKLGFTTQPGNGTGGSPFSTQPVVALQDAGGNTVTGTPQNVTLAIQTNAGPNAILSGTKTVAVIPGTGLATFSGLSIDSTGNGYTLTATGSTVSTSPGVVVSSAFNITTGLAAKIAITRQPGNGTGGSALSTQPVVTLQDAGGNTVTGTAQNITFAIQTNAGPGGVLSGTTLMAVNTGTGQAVFTNLAIDKIGNGYTLTATGSTVSTSPGVIVSSAFNITTGAAAKLGFTTQPGNGSGGGALSPQPVVTLQDAGGNTVLGVAQTVTMAIQNNAGPGGVLSGTNPVAVNIVTGQAVFTNLSIDKIGNGYTLTATGSTVSTSPGVVVSTAFNVANGVAAKIAFTTQPGNGTGGSAFSVQPVVTLQDAGGNTVLGQAQTVTLAIQNNAGPAGVLSGTAILAVNTVTGQAVFTNLSIDKIGNGYTLTATGSTVSTTPGVVVSSPFNVTLGPAAKLGFVVQPSNTPGGATITPAVTVHIQDAGGNTVTTDTRNVSLAIGTNPPGNGVLTGGGAAAAVAGVATFAGLSIDRNGTGYTLIASSAPVLTTATSTPFNIATGGLTHFTVEQTGGGAVGPQTAGTPFGLRITARDAGNNVVTTFTGNVNVTSNGIFAAGGGLSTAFVAGVLDPWSVTISNTGTDSITATRNGGAEKGTSNTFAVNSGPVNNFLVENFGGGVIPQQTAGISFNIRLTARDINGNTVTGFSGNASLTSNAGLVGAPLVTATFVSGVLASQPVTLTLAGTANRTITATAGSQNGTSAAFTVVSSTPSIISVSAGDNQTAGVTTAFPIGLAALVTDQYTNPVNGATVTFTSPAAGATGTWTALHSTTALTAASGIATASTFTAGGIAGAYVDTAKVAGAATPALFHLTNTAGVATKLVIVTPPSATDTAGRVFATQPVIWIEDAGNNLVTTFNGTVLAARTAGTGALQGVTTVTALNGIATFSGLSYNVAETITITFSSPSNPGLTSATTGNLVVRPGPPTGLAFTVSPITSTAGAALAPAPVVTLQDQFGNTVTNVAQNVTLALQTNPGADVLGGTTTVAVVLGTGQATFNGLTLTHAATGYSLTATGSTVSTTPGLVQSTLFNVVHSTASEVRVETLADGSGVVLPSQNVSSGTSITVYSIARDQYHNFISDTTAAWSLVGRTGSVAPSDLVASGDGKSAMFTGALIGTASIRAATTGIATSVQSGVLTVVVAGNAARISVETSATGTGVVLPDSTIASGRSITVYAIGRDNAGNFVRNISANWSIQNATGGVVAGDMSTTSGRSMVFTGHLIGTGQIRADSAGLTAVTSGTVTVNHGSPASVTATAGSGQSALIGTTFSQNLQATVRDSSGNLVGGAVLVTFSAPSSGASGTFGGSIAVLTNPSGVATAPAFTANRVAGTYTDTARVNGVTLPALFPLRNTAAGAAFLTPAAGTTPQHTQVSTFFPVLLAAIATDSSGNRVPGVSVTFTPPSTASSGSFGVSSTVLSDSTGTATAPPYAANGISGPDTVRATASGVATPARFILTNDPAGAQNIVVNRTPFDTALVATVFKDSCQVAVRDQFNNPVSGVWVTFTAPPSGSSVTFGRTGKAVDSALTTSAGLATSSAITANTVSGDYHINATTPSINGTATFFRTNRAGPVTKFQVEAAAGGLIGTQQATVPFDILITSRDVYNNPSVFQSLPVNVSITSNAALLSGGGTVPMNAGVVQTMAFLASGTSDTIKVAHVGGTEKGASNAFAVVNPVPTLTSVAPPNGRKGQTLDVVLTGTGFIANVTAPSFGGFIVPQTWHVDGPTQMTVTITINSSAPDGAYNVSVINGAPGGGTGTLSGGFTVGNTPAPKILSILPTTGSRLQVLSAVIRGSGFFGGVTSVNMGQGITVDSTKVDSVSQITAVIRIAAGAALGVRNVIVANTVAPGTGGGFDTLKNGFTVNNPVPTIYSLSQSAGARSHVYKFAFIGSNFITGVSTPSFDDTAMVITSFTVDSATGITVNLTIGASAAIGPHIAKVTNAGPGGGTGTLAGAFTVSNPPPSLASIFPNTGNRLESNTYILKGLNFVPGLTKVLFIPSNDITIVSSTVDSVDQITAIVTIGASAALGQRLVAVYNPPPGGDTSGNVAFTVNLAGPPIPVLRSPANGSAFQPTTVALRWSPSAGATGYRVQLSTSQLFTTVKTDTPVTDTSAVVGPLTMNTTYYWRVSSSNALATSSYSGAWSFAVSYPARIPIFDTVSFASLGSASDYHSTDYRLVGLPGAGPIPVANYLGGTAGTDWNVVGDNGAATGFWVPYAAGPQFTFGAGRGFWLVKRGNWTVKDTVASASLDGSGQFAIPLHSGWNIIADPFTSAVSWSEIIALNPPTTANHPLNAYTGTTYITPTIFAPNTGYYFENTDTLASLKIPYHSGPVAGKPAVPSASGGWTVRIDLNAGGALEQVVGIGTSPEAVKGLNRMDYHRPRAMNGVPSVVLNRPAWDAVNSEFATDIRPPVQDVDSWDVEVRTTLRTPVQLAFRDVATVPSQFQVFLVDEGRARSIDIRSAPVFTFTPATDVSTFKVVVGTPEGVRSQIDDLLPKAFSLGNNFPNPFNPETTIPVAVPSTSQIRLVVYNILGAEVRTLYDGSIEGGKYWFRWDGRSEHGNTVASGVYFVRLITARGLTFTQRMMFVK